MHATASPAKLCVGSRQRSGYVSLKTLLLRASRVLEVRKAGFKEMPALQMSVYALSFSDWLELTSVELVLLALRRRRPPFQLRPQDVHGELTTER